MAERRQPAAVRYLGQAEVNFSKAEVEAPNFDYVRIRDITETGEGPENIKFRCRHCGVALSRRQDLAGHSSLADGCAKNIALIFRGLQVAATRGQVNNILTWLRGTGFGSRRYEEHAKYGWGHKLFTVSEEMASRIRGTIHQEAEPNTPEVQGDEAH